MNNFNIFLIGFTVFILNGCASMNKSECVNADWRIIGLDDGTAGRLQSNIRRHQKACSKHDITPNMKAYQMGHAEGVKRFCTRDNGFNLGNNGRSYNGVCPQHLSGKFMDGYKVGRVLYEARSRVSSLENYLQSAENEKYSLESDITEMQVDLVNGGTTPEERATLLIDILDYKKRVDNLEDEIDDLEDELAIAQDDYMRLRQQHGY